MDVKVTVMVGARTMRIDEVRDARIRTALQATANQVGEKLGEVVCPIHNRNASDVRIHFDRTGAADLKYESCCAELGAKITAALG